MSQITHQTKPAPKRTFDREFKLQVVRRLQSGEKRMAQICREHNLCQTIVRRWREIYEQKGENAWLEQTSNHVASDDKARIASLEAALGRAHLELDFMRHYARELEQKKGLPYGKSGK
jgi:transposase-like protein